MKNIEDETLHTLGSNVLWFRTRLDISQEELAFRAELQRNYVGEIERAEAVPSIKAIARLSQALGVRPFELLVERLDAMKFWQETRQMNARAGKRTVKPRQG